MKKSFTLLELILIILLLAILYTSFIPKNNINKLNEITTRIILYLKEVRYKALIESKYNLNEDLWIKERWTLKFLRCRSSVGGLYFTIYSDKNQSGQVRKEDTLKDPLTNKYIYSSNSCKESTTNSKYVLLTKNFNIENINVSCNNTNSLGQISFGNNGKIYTKLSSNKNEYELKNRCKIELFDKFNNISEIIIEPKTGFIHKNTNLL